VGWLLSKQITADFQWNTIPSQTTVHSEKKSGKKSKKKVMFLEYNPARRGIIKQSFSLIIAFLLSRFMIPGEIFPGGAAFGLFNANRQVKWPERLLILAGVFLGSWSVKGLESAGGIIGSLFIVYLTAGLLRRQKWTRLNNVTLFTVWSLLRFGLTAILEPTVYGFCIAAVEIIISLILTLIFKTGFAYLDNPYKGHSKVSLLALAVVTVLALGGAAGISVKSVNVVNISTIFVLMIVSYLGGGGAGAAMGISVALVLGITAGGLAALVAVYGVAGLLGGLLKDLGKWGTFLGTCLGLYFVMQQQHLDLYHHSIPWGMGMVSFLIVPRRYLTQMSNYFSNGSSLDFPEEQRRLREIINNRLNDLAGIFAELAKSFSEEPEPVQPSNQKTDLYTLLDQVCTKNCQHCNGYEVCWGENFYSTYREIFDLVALAELYGEVGFKHLKGRLATSCFQQYKLLATINLLFEKCQADHHWQRKLDESKIFMASQLKGVSNIISNLATEVTTDASFKSEVEEKLRHGFNRIGMYVKEVSVLSFGDLGLEVQINQHGCSHARDCQFLAAPMISKLLGQEYMVWERGCLQGNGECSYSVIPVRNYEIKTTVCKLPKDGNEFSGDNHALHELKDGNFVSILSDGMGHGSKAAQESKTTVTILEKLLETGIDSDFAVKMVNSVLLLRTPEETFATVDLALINLYSAQAEFIKIGAATTYIKRGADIWTIKSTSLPAGILNTVDVERTSMQLQPGDLVILVTDGIVDSKQNTSGKEEWMVRALRQVEVVGPEALGEYLLNMARINQDGIARDDMTVIILQLVMQESM
jgi:stage II sporulation protein E